LRIQKYPPDPAGGKDLSKKPLCGAWLSLAEVIAAERVELAVGTDHVRAAAVDPILVPGAFIHERLYEESESIGFFDFEPFHQVPKSGIVAAAFPQV
jgi:hypothetical protein